MTYPSNSQFTDFVADYQRQYGDPFAQEDLVDELVSLLRGGHYDPSRAIYRISLQPPDQINRIWSDALRRVTPQPCPSLWQRIASFFTGPTPDNRPGGMWR